MQKCREFTNYLQALSYEKNIFEVEFSSWTATDRCTLLTQTLPSDDFVELLMEKLVALKTHSFITKQQSEFHESKKNKLAPGEILLVLDFSENYKFVAQHAAQAFHFNNDQATIFPVVYYYVKNSVLCHKSLIFISECTKHDTAAVYTIQKLLVPYLKRNHNPKKIIYFSDGAKQHFKNKYQMVNLVNHEIDFGVKAEWHCHPTAHAKGPSDASGASFKREAVRFSLLKEPKTAILGIERLFEWSTSRFTETMKTFYYSQQDYQKNVRFLNRRFDKAPAVPQIMKNHAFIVHDGSLIIRRY
ncbi:hypothetical protein TKK_0012981 [Trichogramma kaykai]